MDSINYTIRTATGDDIDTVIEWAVQEGWNPGLNDVHCYYAADNNGFLIGYLGEEAVASISAVKYDDNFGFLGYYIVKPEYRGMGYGLKIWNEGMKYLTGCNIGLDGVVEQQDNYMKSGFKLAFRNIRYGGKGGGEQVYHNNIVDLESLPFEDLFEYSKEFFPADRSHFIRQWISQDNCRALGILQDGKLCGYGAIRSCKEGYKIEPLFADTPEMAQSLFVSLKAVATSSDKVYLDVPEINSAAVELAESNNMTAVFETARMYTGVQPDLSHDRLYGITSFEIG